MPFTCGPGEYGLTPNNAIHLFSSVYCYACDPGYYQPNTISWGDKTTVCKKCTDCGPGWFGVGLVLSVSFHVRHAA
jgi:hypothetical protein